MNDYSLKSEDSMAGDIYSDVTPYSIRTLFSQRFFRKLQFMVWVFLGTDKPRLQERVEWHTGIADMV